MVRNKTVLLPFLCMLIFAQSCVHGDMDDCPPMVQYAVAFEYRHHMRSPNPGVDLFYTDVKQINLYVFDKQDLVYTTVTKLGPYETKFNIPLDLPMGNYHIIAWGDVLDDQPFKMNPSPFIKGVTTLNEARLILQRTLNNRCKEDFEKLFYGERSVSIPMYVSRIDTVPLINDSNNIRVVIHWDHSGLLPGDANMLTYDDISVRLVGENAVYDFDNRTQQDSVIYEPTVATRSTGAPPTRENELKINAFDPLIYYNTTDSACYEFRVLRLVPDEPLNLVVLQQASPVVQPENLFASPGTPDRYNQTFGPDVVGDTNGSRGFAELKRSVLNVTAADMQSSFDKYENYRVDVVLKYEKQANTYIAVPKFNIQDWHKIIIEVPGWQN